MPETALDCTTTLADGRTVVMRGTNAYDEDQAETILAREGVKPEGFGMMRYIRFLALSAVESVGEQKWGNITTFNEYKMRLMALKSSDMARILELYNRVNGRGDGTVEGNDAG